MFWSGDAPQRFLLKGMDNPNVVTKLKDIDDAKRIAFVLDREFPDASAKTLQRFGDLGCIPLTNLGQGARGFLLSRQREIAEVFFRPLDPRNRANCLTINI